MQLHWLDWVFIFLYFLLSIYVGLRFTKKASTSIADYFVSGRSMPWWLAGTSMVATTFAADTPLAVTGLVAMNGIAGNWLWWNFLMSGMLTVFFYARLWRRAGVLTDVEFTELRYGGKPAAFLRCFRALYLAIPINCIIMSWVLLAMIKILGVTLSINKIYAVLICIGVTLIYTTLSGLWGIIFTDLIQFVIAMSGSVILMFFALNKVDGVSGLKVKLIEQYGADNSILNFFPTIGSEWMPLSAFLVYIGVQWWASWYPGSEPGGGGYVAQRMFSAKNEKHSLLATLWFNIAHYAIRPWPWILVALVTLVLYPNLEDKESGYILAMVDLLPRGFAGLLLAAFAAAFMSTMSTMLNWGSSYFVNDFYKRFIKPEENEKHYVVVSKVSTVFLMILAGLCSMIMDTISGAWMLLMAIGAGTGLVLILRWFWWRINAWSEISSMIASFIIAVILQNVIGLNAGEPKQFALVMLLTVLGTTIIWLIVTYLTKPEADTVLLKFYEKVQPGGNLWKPIALKSEITVEKKSLYNDFIGWFSGCVLVYSLLFGVGKLILGYTYSGVIILFIGLLSGYIIYKIFKNLSFIS
ncbi:MAG: Na+:solute symporter [Oligoflexia bacterium]|nr:Na+:solute symporter [Oligoflexia bacterium]